MRHNGKKKTKKENLDVSVSAYGSEALQSYRIWAGGLKSGGLRLHSKPDGSSVRTIFEGLCTEDGTGADKAIFEGGLELAASEVRENFDDTYLSVHRVEYWSESTSTQEYQKFEGKLKHNSTWEQLGSDQGVIGEPILKRKGLIHQNKFMINKVK